MKIIEQSVEIITEPNPIKRIEMVGRVCWKSEHRITEDSAKPFVAGLIKRGHTSPLEHARVVVPSNHIDFYLVNEIAHVIYGMRNRIDTIRRKSNGEITGINVNVRDFVATLAFVYGDNMKEKEILSEVEKLENASDYMTVKFTTDIGMTRELLRHRQMSFMELSTRYVNYQDGIEFIKPEWYTHKHWGEQHVFEETILKIEKQYKCLIERGFKPQEARAILPLCTKTELYMTGMLSQWKDVFALRESPAAHPQMRNLMALLREEMAKKGIEVE